MFIALLVKCFLSLFLFLITLQPLTSYAFLVNRTIDDSLGDSKTGQTVIYAPENSWNGTDCGGCWIKPDTTQTFDATYTAVTYQPEFGSMSIEMHFSGIAIYVFFVLVGHAGKGVTTFTQANFTVDGKPPVFFKHTPDVKSADFMYNQLVFHQTGLQNGNHTLVISTSGVESAYLCFDYAIYTYARFQQSELTPSRVTIPVRDLEDDLTNPKLLAFSNSSTTDTSVAGDVSKTTPPQPGVGMGQNQSLIIAVAWSLSGGLVFLAASLSITLCIVYRKEKIKQASRAGDGNMKNGQHRRDWTMTQQWVVDDNIEPSASGRVTRDSELNRLTTEMAFLRDQQYLVRNQTLSDDVLPQYSYT